MTVEVFANQPTTTVAAAQSTSSTTWTVGSSISFPTAATGVSQFHVADPAAPSELVLVTNVSVATWTVVRGAEGTTPVAHSAGFTVVQVISAGWLNSVATSTFPLPLGVANGGSGDTAFTSYALLAGGTSATSPVQQVSGLGTSGYVLTSNGASALPTWQSGGGGAATALADLSGSVNVSNATAPTTGQVLTATSSTTATWQPGTASSTANYLADLSGSVNVSLATAPTATQVLTATSSTTATWQASAGNSFTRHLWTVPSPGATYTAATWELTAVSTSSGSGTVVLPTTPTAVSGTQNAVKQIILGSGNEVTIQTQGSDVFSFTGGGTTNTLTLAGQAAVMQYDGTSIWTIYADDLPASQIVILAEDLGNTSALPQVVSTHLTVSTNTAASGTVNVNATSTRVFNYTQSGAATYTFTSSGLTASVAYSFEMYLNPGTFATTWPGSVTWIPAGTAPTLVPSTENLLVFETINQGTTWYGATVQDAPTLPLPVADGGTGVVSLSSGAVILGGTSNVSPLTTVSGVGTSGEVLTSNGTASSPTWQTAASSLPLTTPGDLVYENASTVASRLAIGSSGQLLGVSGGLPVWQNAPGVSGVTAASLGLGLLTMQPNAATNSAGTSPPVPAEDILFVLCTAAPSQTVSVLGAFVAQAGVTTGSGINQMALYSAAGSLLQYTNDMTAGFESAGAYAEGTLGTAATLVQGTNYYIALTANFTATELRIAGITAVNATVSTINGNYIGCVLASQTSWPTAFTPSTAAKNANLPLMYAR